MTTLPVAFTAVILSHIIMKLHNKRNPRNNFTYYRFIFTAMKVVGTFVISYDHRQNIKTFKNQKMSPTGNSYNNYVDSFFDVYYIKHVLVTLSISSNIKKITIQVKRRENFQKLVFTFVKINFLLIANHSLDYLHLKNLHYFS